MKTHVTLFALAVATFSAFAADITGTWKAEFNTQRGLQKYTFTLKQDGAGLTGKMSADLNGEKREAELKEGKVEVKRRTEPEAAMVSIKEVAEHVRKILVSA